MRILIRRIPVTAAGAKAGHFQAFKATLRSHPLAALIEIEKNCGEFIKKLFEAAERQTGRAPASTSILALFDMVKPENIRRGAMNLGGSLKDGTAYFEIGRSHGGSTDPETRRREIANVEALFSIHQIFHLSGYTDVDLAQAIFHHMPEIKSAPPPLRAMFPGTAEGHADFIHSNTNYWDIEISNRCTRATSVMK